MNVLFELGQGFKARAVALVPNWFSGIPLFENTKNFFLLGTFFTGRYGGHSFGLHGGLLPG